MAAAPGKPRAVTTNPDSFPIGVEQEILTLDNAVFIPHYASYTEEAYQELRVKTAENAAAVLRGEFPKYLYNPEVKANARLLNRR